MTIRIKPPSERGAYSASRKPAVLIFRSNNLNVGHMLGDLIDPIFQMLSTFDLDENDYQLITFKDQLIWYETRSSEVFLDAITQGEPRLQESSEPRCFETMILGANGMSYIEGEVHARTLERFRDFVLGKLGIVASPPRRHPTILVIVKNMTNAVSKSGISNYDEVLRVLSTEFPTLNIRNVSWLGMSFKSQLSLMQEVDIVVSLPGTDLMNALFLPYGGAIFVPCRKVQQIETSNEVRIWFKSFPSLRSIEVCNDHDIQFEGQQAHINTTSFAMHMKEVVQDWLTRRSIYLKNGLEDRGADSDTPING